MATLSDGHSFDVFKPELNLTLGFIFKFNCVYNPSALTASFSKDGIVPLSRENGIITPAHAIYALMDVAGMDVLGWEQSSQVNEDLLLEAPYSRWHIKTDETELTDQENAARHQTHRTGSVKVSSPKLNYSDDWQGQLHSFLQALALIEHNYGVRILLNGSTSFHIHVGNNSSFIPLRTCKRILQIATAHERNFDAMHIADRIRQPSSIDSDNTVYPLCAPPSFFLELQDLAHHPTIFSRLRMIETADTFKQLGGLFSVLWIDNYTDGINSAYNFDHNFADPDSLRHLDDLKYTVEFRQHSGTIDLPSILAWTHVVTSVVAFAHICPEMPFLKLLADGTDAAFNLDALLDTIGCPPDVIAHYRRDGNETPGALTALGQLPGADLVRGGLEAAELADIDAANDHEQSLRTDPTLTRRAIQRKWLAKAYGVDPHAGPLRVDVQWLSARFAECWAEANTGSDADIDDGSVVRMVLMELLHRKYLGENLGIFGDEMEIDDKPGNESEESEEL